VTLDRNRDLLPTREVPVVTVLMIQAGRESFQLIRWLIIDGPRSDGDEAATTAFSKTAEGLTRRADSLIRAFGASKCAND
jgi:hypothetical protein